MSDPFAKPGGEPAAEFDLSDEALAERIIDESTAAAEEELPAEPGGTPFAEYAAEVEQNLDEEGKQTLEAMRELTDAKAPDGTKQDDDPPAEPDLAAQLAAQQAQIAALQEQLTQAQQQPEPEQELPFSNQQEYEQFATQVLAAANERPDEAAVLIEAYAPELMPQLVAAIDDQRVAMAIQSTFLQRQQEAALAAQAAPLQQMARQAAVTQAATEFKQANPDLELLGPEFAQVFAEHKEIYEQLPADAAQHARFLNHVMDLTRGRHWQKIVAAQGQAREDGKAAKRAAFAETGRPAARPEQTDLTPEDAIRNSIYGAKQRNPFG